MCGGKFPGMLYNLDECFLAGILCVLLIRKDLKTQVIDSRCIVIDEPLEGDFII